jgi:flagellar protein FlaG
MRISVSPVSPNVGGAANQNVNNQVQAPEPKKVSTPESTKEIAQKPKHELSLGEKQWIDVIEKANKALEGATSSFEFSIHEQTKQIMIKVIDKETKEVIREFPPEKILDMVAKLWEVAGILVDERR